MPINQQKNDRALERLIARLRRKSKPLAVTGAGVSVWAGYRTWAEVIDDLARAVGESNPGIDTATIIQNNRNPLHCAQNLGAYLGPRFADFIQAEFGPKAIVPGSLPLTLCNLPFRHFLTFNIDPSLEQIHIQMPRPCVAVTTGNLRNCRDLTLFMREDSDGADRRVVHLHGAHNDPPELIALTNDGYARLYQPGSLFSRFVWWLVTSQCLVFLGYGFADMDFLNLMRTSVFDLSPGKPLHFAVRGITAYQNDEEIRNELNNSFRIDPIFYEIGSQPENRHAGFADLIRGIPSQLDIPEAEIPASPVEEITIAAEPADIQRANELSRDLIDKIDPREDANDVSR